MRQPTAVTALALTVRATTLVAMLAAILSCSRRQMPSDAWAPDHARAASMDTGVPRASLEAGSADAAVAVPTIAPPDASPPPSIPSPRVAGFLGGDDDALLHRLCDEEVARIERNRGGSTISFRVWFGRGLRGLFKPQQHAEVANFRAELAAYRLSHLLHLNRVPPACGRRVDRSRLQTVADGSGDATFSDRVLHEVLGRGDLVPGAMLYWVPGPLEPVPGTDRWNTLLDASQPLAETDRTLASDLSTLIAFDFVTDNVDRWSGGNILRQHLGNQDPGPMLFMDNGASFSIGPDGTGARPRDQLDRLMHVQRFSRAFVSALRALTADALRTEMARDPLGPLLGSAQIDAVLHRRDLLIQYIDAAVQAHGAETVLAFP